MTTYHEKLTIAELEAMNEDDAVKVYDQAVEARAFAEAVEQEQMKTDLTYFVQRHGIRALVYQLGEIFGKTIRDALEDTNQVTNS